MKAKPVTLPSFPGHPTPGPGLWERSRERAEADPETPGVGAGNGPPPGPGGGVQLGVEVGPGPGRLLCGTLGGIQRAGAFKTSGARRLHSAVHPRRRLGASCSQGSPSTTYLPAPTLSPGFPTAPRAGGGPCLPEKPWDSPQPQPQAAGGDGQLAAALRRGPEAVGSPAPLSPAALTDLVPVASPSLRFPLTLVSPESLSPSPSFK